MKNEEVETKPKKKAALKVESMFPREEIMKQPSAFGVSHFVLIGAMAEMNDKEYSRSQVIEAVKKFEGRKVEQK